MSAVANVQRMEPLLRLGSEGERFQLGGFEAVFKCPANGGSGWTAAEYTLPPRQNGAPLHYHNHLIESFYVLSGDLWLRVGDSQRVAGPGSFAFVPPGTLHSFANRSAAPVRFLLHASDAAHHDFLLRIYDMARAAESWPPKDPTAMIVLGEEYDTYYV